MQNMCNLIFFYKSKPYKYQPFTKTLNNIFLKNILLT